ncbi:hypothetical protein AB0M12_41100 [Nocardia vinacea]
MCAESETFAGRWARSDVAVPHSRTKQSIIWRWGSWRCS